jgi:cell division protein FtsW
MSQTQAYTSSVSPGKALQQAGWDVSLIYITMALLAIGLVMVASASIPLGEKIGQPFIFFLKQSAYVSLGLLATYLVTRIPMSQWQKAGAILLILSFVLLIAVILPGVGKQVNGSMRWLPLGIINLQVSELVKLIVYIYMAGFLVRRGDEVRNSLRGFFKPMIILSLTVVLLLMQPDFGAAVVLLATALGMMYMSGVGLVKFIALIVTTIAAMAMLALVSPYRVARILSFTNPWADPFNSGFQLTQSLIAFGRGEIFGVGLGGSIQKLFYLPETHTDFLFAILAEELGLIGATTVILLFATLVWRAFAIGAKAEREQQLFSAYLAYGLGIWIGLQAFINIGVNMGVLPTKGLTLPLMSYGGSSIVITLVAIGLLLRIGYEADNSDKQKAWAKKRGWRRES